MQKGNLSETIANFAFNFSNKTIPYSSIEIFKICLADWVSLLVASKNNEISNIVLSLLDDNIQNEDAFAIGAKSYVSTRMAALINGTISHSLDYDDTHFGYLGHPSVVVIPASLAISDKYKLNFNQFMAASILGMEVCCRLGMWLGRKHYRSGFHITSTAGIFGATIGVSKLLNLSKKEIVNAIGITSSHSSGLKEQFGSMVKPYQVGMASSSSIEAVTLAKNGLLAARSALDGTQGFGSTHNGEFNKDAFDSLGQKFIFETLTHKFHACCHGTHSTIEALTHLRDKFSIKSYDIVNISIFIHPQYMKVCNILNPKTGIEAKFSYKMISAMVMHEINTSKIESFSDNLNKNETLVEFMKIINIYPNENIEETSSKVVIKTKSNDEFSYKYDLNDLKDIEKRKSKMKHKTSSLLGHKMSESLWKMIKSEDLLPSEWIWNNYN